MKNPVCMLCSSTTNTVIRKTLRYEIKRDVLQCTRCSLVFLAPQSGATAYYTGKAYRKRHGPTLHKASSMREIFDAYFPHQGPIVEAVRTHLRPSMKILDVGCSTGHFLAALKGKAKERVGLELGKDEASFIRKNLDFKVYTDPIESAHIAEGPFDLITALQVLEHVPEPKSFLHGISRHLKPNGLLYLELPNIDDVLLSVFGVKGYADFYFREPHVCYYSKKTLKTILSKAGFVGEFGTVQRYSFYNHLHWIQTGRPQASFADGNTIPEVAKGAGAPFRAKKEITAFLHDANLQYQKLVEKHMLGESLTFWGRKMF